MPRGLEELSELESGGTGADVEVVERFLVHSACLPRGGRSRRAVSQRSSQVPQESQR
ncbi:hypothetical protein ACFV2H_50380 [Streptomyces sp. NPDC059629]|uniref:hypothetical protein n=1 Tax=Streptomyces sp. NPDC059629 TaxID=3346889 RepID=UPI0036C3A82B